MLPHLFALLRAANAATGSPFGYRCWAKAPAARFRPPRNPIPTAAKFDLWASTAAQSPAVCVMLPTMVCGQTGCRSSPTSTGKSRKPNSARSFRAHSLPAANSCTRFGTARFRCFASAGKSAAGSAASRNSAASAPGGKSRLKAGDNFAGLADTLTECHRAANVGAACRYFAAWMIMRGENKPPRDKDWQR